MVLLLSNSAKNVSAEFQALAAAIHSTGVVEHVTHHRNGRRISVTKLMVDFAG